MKLQNRMESTWSYTSIKWTCSNERSVNVQETRTIVRLDLWRRALDEHPCAILLSSNEDWVRCRQERCRRLDSSWGSRRPRDTLWKWRASKLPRRELHWLRALLHGPTATARCVLWQQIHTDVCLTVWRTTCIRVHDNTLIMFATVYKTVQELTVLMSQNERRSTSGCFYIPHTAYITPTNLTVQSPSSDSKEITSRNI